MMHQVNDEWTFNGDFVSPTFSPSILVTGGENIRCHSFVEEGKIRFLDDCNHALAGKTVQLPPWDDHLRAAEDAK
jgi:hypothetical protein